MSRWNTSRRKQSLPPGWAAIRRAVLNRDHHRCTWHTGPGQTCGARANQVDHIGSRDDHRISNLRSLCAEHHARKSAGEGHDAMRAIRARGLHPVEQHPALREG